jgi:hypothetical protein
MGDDVGQRIADRILEETNLLRWLHAEAAFERDRLQAENDWLTGDGHALRVELDEVADGARAAEGDFAAARAEVSRLSRELDRLHSWQGLMSLLDEHWPATVFKSSTEDPGPTIVFLLREVHRLRREVEFEAKGEPWGRGTIVAPTGHGYVNGGNCCECGEPTPTVRTYQRHVHSLLRACACISDAQASRLGPRFSRPVCAVHEQRDASDA